MELGKDESNQDVVEDRKNNVKPNDLATIIYTSGTTGKPKGVMLSHDNIVSNVFAGAMRIPYTEGNYRTMSYLPVCHILERFYLYLCQYYSISIYFGESLDKIGENIKEVKPHLITGVPRVLEKIYDKIYSKGLELKGIKKMLFFWAINLGVQFEPYDANGWWYKFQLKIARKLIFSKWKEAVGGNLQLIACGSAALQPRLARIFAAAEITIMEGYGLTETSPLVAINDMRNNGFKIGTVGKVIDKVEVKIAEDGEILCKGPNIMLGYYKDEAQTKEVMTDGYFHTGDIGEIDSEGFLKITDRKKEMFKTSGGKYVSPQLLENAMKQSRFIEQIMVIGDGFSNPPASGVANYTGTSTSNARSVIAPGQIGTFTLSVNFGTKTFTFNSATERFTSSGNGAIDLANGLFATSNMNIVANGIAYSGTMYGQLNGNLATSPIVGTYSGANLPPSFTSTSPTGCLYFSFISIYFIYFLIILIIIFFCFIFT